MDMLDVLYTPLDIPPCPKIDLGRLNEWVNRVYPQRKLLEKTSGVLTAHELLRDSYPWNSTFAKLFQWQDSFFEEFPEIVNYIRNDWQLDDTESAVLLLLPSRVSSTGFGFWHSDADSLGLRFYIDFEDTEHNKLFIRQTVKNDTGFENLNKNFDEQRNVLADLTTEAKVVHPRQAFYLNNIRGGHAVWNSLPSSRIAVILGTQYDSINRNKYKYLRDRFNKLIVESAMNHKEAIFCNNFNNISYGNNY